jgi:hypothetical protein
MAKYQILPSWVSRFDMEEQQGHDRRNPTD